MWAHPRPFPHMQNYSVQCAVGHTDMVHGLPSRVTSGSVVQLHLGLVTETAMSSYDS